ATLLGVGRDLLPRPHRITPPLPGLSVHLQQNTTHIRISHSRGRIRVPGERGAARTTTRLVLRAIRTHRRIIGRLSFPGDDSVFDINIPGARARAVDTVRGTDDLVVAPTVPIEDVPF